MILCANYSFSVLMFLEWQYTKFRVTWKYATDFKVSNTKCRICGIIHDAQKFRGGGQLSNLFILFTTFKAASEHAYALSLSILITVTQVTS